MNPIIKLLTFAGKMGKDWAKMSPEHKKKILALYGLTGSGIAALFKSADSGYIGEKSQVADEIDPSIENNMNQDKQLKNQKQLSKKAMEELESIAIASQVLNLFGDKSSAADEIDPTVFKGLYNPFPQPDSLKNIPIDPVTGSRFNELDFVPEMSDWTRKNIYNMVKDPNTGEWYKPDHPLGSDGGNPTYDPEFHKLLELDKETQDGSNLGKRFKFEGQRIRDYLKKQIESIK
jgi:hypothetical protein